MGTGRTDEFLRDAVRIALTRGLSRQQVADALGVGKSTLNKWVTAHRDTDVVSFEGRVTRSPWVSCCRHGHVDLQAVRPPSCVWQRPPSAEVTRPWARSIEDWHRGSASRRRLRPRHGRLLSCSTTPSVMVSPIRIRAPQPTTSDTGNVCCQTFNGAARPLEFALAPIPHPQGSGCFL
jgi:transposase